jgi:quinol monooxygenase YgiN
MSPEGPRLTRDLPHELGPKQEGERHDEDAPDRLAAGMGDRASRKGRGQKRSVSMVIVAGHITVEPQQRDSYLVGRVSVVERARGAAGCLDFAITADLVDPGGVNVFERRESQAAVEAFRGGPSPSEEQAAAMLSASVAEYDIADVRPVFEKYAV